MGMVQQTPTRAKMKALARVSLGASLLAIACASQASAQDEPSWTDRIELRAVLDVETALSTNDGNLQKFDINLDPEMRVDLGDIGRLTATGRLRFDPVNELEPDGFDNQSFARSAVSRRLFVGDLIDAELREFYLDTNIGSTFLRLGKQIVVWGEADGLQVLNVINPLSFRESIIPDFEDRQIPLWMVNAERELFGANLQLLWIPDHTYNEVPNEESTFAFSSPLFIPEIPSDLTIPVNLNEPDRPNQFIEDDDFAAKLSGFNGGWDWSINYLYHYPDTPVIRREITPNPSVDVSTEYERSHLIGGTASNAFGKFTLRSEVALATDKYFLVDDLTDADGVTQSGEISYVMGLDYQLDGDTFLSGQIFQSILTSPDNATIRGDVETTVTALVSRSFRNDTLSAELLLLHNLNRDDGLATLELDYQYSTNLSLKAGVDVFYGDRDGFFGQHDGNDRIRVGFEFGF